MTIFKQKLTFSPLNYIFILIFFQLIILKLSFATSVESIVSNGQPVSSALSETLEFSDSIPGFEHHEFQSQRIKPLSVDKLQSNKSSVTKVTNSATLAVTLLKKIGLPSTPKYFNNNSSNKTILNSVLIKRTNRPSTATLITSSNLNLKTTTPIPSFDENDLLKKQFYKLSNPSTNSKLLRLSKKKKAKQTTYKASNASSLQQPSSISSTTSPASIDLEKNELTSSSLAPNGIQATEQHSVVINHGQGAISTIRRTLNSNSQPSYEHVQIGFPNINGNSFSNDPFPNFPNINLDFTPPPIPQPIDDRENLNNNHHNNLNQQPPSSQPIIPPKAIQAQHSPPRDEQSPPPIIQPPMYPTTTTNRNGRLRGAHKKQVHVNRRKSAALVKENELNNNDLNNQIVPVSVGLPNSFQNVKPQDLPNFAEISFFGYRNDQNAPRPLNEREHYNANNFEKQPSLFNHRSENNNFNQPQTGRLNNNNAIPPPPPPPPANEFNFNLHPFFSSNERRNQPNNNDMYQFFDTPFMPMNPPPAIHNLNNIHSHVHHGDNHQLNHQINHQVFHQPIDSNEIGPPYNNHASMNTPPNGQFFQRRKLTLNNGNQLNEISNNNLGYGYPSYNVYKSDEDAGIKYPKIFKFVDGRINLSDFEKEKKLGKIEFGKSVAEDGNEYTFDHVRRDLFLILHGGSFSY